MQRVETVDLHLVNHIVITGHEDSYEIRGYNNGDLEVIEKADTIEVDSSRVRVEVGGELSVLAPTDGVAWFSVTNDGKAVITRG